MYMKMQENDTEQKIKQKKMKDTKKTQVESLEMRNTVFQMENIMDGINTKLYTREENIIELEYIAIETIQRKTSRKK